MDDKKPINWPMVERWHYQQDSTDLHLETDEDVQRNIKSLFQHSDNTGMEPALWEMYTLYRKEGESVLMAYRKMLEWFLEPVRKESS